MTGINFAPLVALGLVIYTLTNLYKYLTNRNWNAALTLVVGWATGVAAVWLVGATSWAHTISVGGSQTLDHLSFVEKLLVGLVVVSASSTIFDFKKAFDGTDSAVHPPLVPGASEGKADGQ